MKRISFSLFIFLFATILSVNAQTTDLYQVIMDGNWVTNLQGVSFQLWLNEGKRQFTVAEVGGLEQHYGIGGPLKAVKGKANTYTFTAKDDFNGYPYIFRGTITFTQIAGGKIKVSIKCPDPEDGYSLPHKFTLKKRTSKRKK